MDKLKTGISTNLDFIRFMKEKGQTVNPNLPPEKLRDQLDAINEAVKVTFDSTNETVLEAANGSEPPAEMVTITVEVYINNPVSEYDIDRVYTKFGWDGELIPGTIQAYTYPKGTTDVIVAHCEGYTDQAVSVTFEEDTAMSITLEERAISGPITFIATGLPVDVTPVVDISYEDPDTHEMMTEEFTLPQNIASLYGSQVIVTNKVPGYKEDTYYFTMPYYVSETAIPFDKIYEFTGFTSITDDGTVVSDQSTYNANLAILEEAPESFYGKIVDTQSNSASGYCDKVSENAFNLYDSDYYNDRRYVEVAFDDELERISIQKNYRYNPWTLDTVDSLVGFPSNITIDLQDEFNADFISRMMDTGTADANIENDNNIVVGTVHIEVTTIGDMEITMTFFNANYTTSATVIYNLIGATGEATLSGSYTIDNNVYTMINNCGVLFDEPIHLEDSGSIEQSATFSAQFIRVIY